MADRKTGFPIPFGHRQNMDYSNPLFVKYADRVIDAVVNRYKDHPAVIGAFGMVEPLPSTDPKKMRATLHKIEKVWNWDSTWGWDYPLLAMTALRLYDAEQAVDFLLMPLQKNTYLPLLSSCGLGLG